MLEEIRKEIEKVIEGYSDGTYQGLSRGHLIEYFSDGSKNPQTLVDEIMVVIKRHLTKRAASPEPLNVIADNTGSPRRGVYRR